MPGETRWRTSRPCIGRRETKRLRPHLVKLLPAKRADPNAAGGDSRWCVGTGAADPAVDRRKSRGRTAIVDALLVAAAPVDQPLPEKIATPKRVLLPKELDQFNNNRLGREGAWRALQTTAARRARRVRPARQQTRLAPSCHQQYRCRYAVGQRPEPVHPPSIGRPPGNRSTWSRSTNSEITELANHELHKPNPLAPSASSHLWLPVVWFSCRRRGTER